MKVLAVLYSNACHKCLFLHLEKKIEVHMKTEGVSNQIKRVHSNIKKHSGWWCWQVWHQVRRSAWLLPANTRLPHNNIGRYWSEAFIQPILVASSTTQILCANINAEIKSLADRKTAPWNFSEESQVYKPSGSFRQLINLKSWPQWSVTERVHAITSFNTMAKDMPAAVAKATGDFDVPANILLITLRKGSSLWC